MNVALYNRGTFGAGAPAYYHSDTLLSGELCNFTYHGNNQCAWNSDYTLLLSDTFRVHKWKRNHHLQYKMKSHIETTAPHSAPALMLRKLPVVGITLMAVAFSYWNSQTNILFCFLFENVKRNPIIP